MEKNYNLKVWQKNLDEKNKWKKRVQQNTKIEGIIVEIRVKN